MRLRIPAISHFFYSYRVVNYLSTFIAYFFSFPQFHLFIFSPLSYLDTCIEKQK